MRGNETQLDLLESVDALGELLETLNETLVEIKKQGDSKPEMFDKELTSSLSDSIKTLTERVGDIRVPEVDMEPVWKMTKVISGGNEKIIRLLVGLNETTDRKHSELVKTVLKDVRESQMSVKRQVESLDLGKKLDGVRDAILQKPDWRFTVNRDNYGSIDTVDATVLKAN